MAKRRPRGETRELILDEAHRMVREQGMPEAIGFRLNDALESLDLTTGAAYNIWESQDEFRVDLALHIARSSDWAVPQELVAQATQLADTVEYRECIRIVAQDYFDYFVTRPEFSLSMYFWTVGDTGANLTALIQEGFGAVDNAFVEVLGVILDRYRYDVVEPYTVSAVAVAATAALQGAALRIRFDSDAMRTAEGPFFGRFVASLVEQATRPAVQQAA